MSLLSNERERIRFIKFAFVGFTGTIVDFGILNLLRIVFSMPIAWAQGISFTCAVINNFIWNRYWTYPESRSKGAPKQLLQFLIINIIGILIRTPLIPWLDNQIMAFLQNSTIQFPLQDSIISQNLALAVGILIVTFWNFFANRYWTYNNIPDGDPIDKSKNRTTPN